MTVLEVCDAVFSTGMLLIINTRVQRSAKMQERIIRILQLQNRRNDV
jgi:hypothetical protein